MVLERLDRLTVDEARMTVEHILEVLCGLIQNMRVVMNGEQMDSGGHRSVLSFSSIRRQGIDAIDRPSPACPGFVC